MNNPELHDSIQNYLSIFIEQKINLKEYALKNNIPIYINNNMDKGWKGNVIEHILNLKKNNKKGADYLGLEIKTVPVKLSGNIYKVKETTCLSVLDTNELIKNNFEQSSLYQKIKSTLFIFINVENEECPIIMGTYYFNLDHLPDTKNQMKKDYNLVVGHIFDNIECGLNLDNNLTGKLGEIIQPRPKTGKKGNYTWAFYLKTSVLNEIVKQIKFPIKTKFTI